MARKRNKTWNLKIEDNWATRLIGGAVFTWAATPVALELLAR